MNRETAASVMLMLAGTGYGDWEIAAAAAPGSGVVVWETIYASVPSIMASAAASP